MHLADAFIQSDLHCIQVTVSTFYQLLLSLGIEPMILALLAPCSTSWATGNICKNTIRWPATAHDVTTGATIIKGSPGEYIISFFVFTDWSVWRNVHSGRNTFFLYLSWRALARRSRSVWIRVLVIWHPMTHTIVASFVWAMVCELFSMRKLRSRLSLFSRKEGQPSASRDSVPTAAEARRRLKSRGSQLDMADELEKDHPFSRVSAENESELLDCDDAIFLTSSDSAVSALLGYAQEEQEMLRVRKLRLNPLNPPALHMNEFLEVMDHKN